MSSKNLNFNCTVQKPYTMKKKSLNCLNCATFSDFFIIVLMRSTRLNFILPNTEFKIPQKPFDTLA
jgi:hypothetical protein